MTKLDIINVPDPLLKTLSTPVDKVDSDIQRLLDNMLETMYEAPGIGLAAIQVAVPKRVIVLDTSGDEEERKPLFLVNLKSLTYIAKAACLCRNIMRK